MRNGKTTPHDGQCGAKTRAGTPCKQKAGWGTDHVGTGRCKLHGGKSTGAKDRNLLAKKLKGNKNSVSTHEHESIVFDFLEEEEKELLNRIEMDQLKQVKNEIKLIDIRLRRMMRRIADLSESEMTSVKATYKKNEFEEEYQEEKRDTLSQIQGIEEAVTRVQAQKLRLLTAKHDLEADLGINLETKEARLENIKAKTENLKGLSSNIEDTSDLRRLLLDEGD